MKRVDGLFHVVRADDRRDVALRRSLRDGVDVDAIVPERGEHLSRDAGMRSHIVADQREDRKTGFDAQRIDLADIYLVFEFAVDGRFGDRARPFVDCDADRMLRRTLRDQDDVDLRPGQRVEKALGKARNSDHSAAFKIEHGDVADARDAADDLVRILDLGLYEGSEIVGNERVLDEDRDILPEHRLDRRRIDHLRAEMRQFHRFAVGDVRDLPDVPDDARVGGHHSRNVRPDLEHFRVERGGEDRAGVVGTSATERRRQAVTIGCDEARKNDEIWDFGFGIADFGLDQAVCRFEIDRREAVVRIGPDEFSRVEPEIFDAFFGETGGNDLRRQYLAETDDTVERPRGQFTQHEDAVANASDLVKSVLDEIEHSVLRSGAEQRSSCVNMFRLEIPDRDAERFVARLGRARDPDQRVRRSLHRRKNDDARLRLRAHDGDDFFNILGAAHRRTAKLEYLHLCKSLKTSVFR